MWIKILKAHGHFTEGDTVYAVEKEKYANTKPTEHYKVCVIDYAKVVVNKGWAEEIPAPDIRVKRESKDKE